MINLKVLDLSHHNQVNSFDMIRDWGIVGVILKATQGTYMRDQTYPARYDAARKAGLLVGAYHFPDSSDPRAQLQFFMDYARLDPRTDLGALDFEEDTTRGHTMHLDQARDWLANFENQFGRKAVFYSGSLIKQTLRDPDDFLSQHKLWLAHYAAAPHCPSQWQAPWLWQYCDGPRTNLAQGPMAVSGISGEGLDCNHFAGLDAELASSWTQ